jgi:hypothetical protein
MKAHTIPLVQPKEVIYRGVCSGLPRMSDLLAMQPNINILLYLVAPEERCNKLMEEVNTPTFSV